MIRGTLERLLAGEELARDDARSLMAAIMDGEVTPAQIAGILVALRAKGETPAEITGFVEAMRERVVAVAPQRDAIDIVGTGVDGANTFNISTTVALVCAAAGVTVAKHGNRAITSQSGSADVLEALGVPIELPPDGVAAALREQRFAFLFAPKFHPAFKHIAPARKLCAERGQRTIFNFLGPLLNPARPSAQIIGVPRPELCEPMAKVLQRLGVRRGMVVCGEVPRPGGPAFLDELSTLGETTVAEFYHDRGFAVSKLSPADFPLHAATLAELAGGDKHANAAILHRLLAGGERGARRDAVLLNAAAGLFVAGQARSISEGWELAERVLDEGAAARKLAELCRR